MFRRETNTGQNKNTDPAPTARRDSVSDPTRMKPANGYARLQMKTRRLIKDGITSYQNTVGGTTEKRVERSVYIN
jgi:hypothetical protein